LISFEIKKIVTAFSTLFLYRENTNCKPFKLLTKMTKADLVAQISEETGLEKNEASRAVESMMNWIKTSLTNGQNVYLRGFGSFIVRERKQKTGRNISKNTTIIIPAHNIPSFKPAKVFVDQVKNKVSLK